MYKFLPNRIYQKILNYKFKNNINSTFIRKDLEKYARDFDDKDKEKWLKIDSENY